MFTEGEIKDIFELVHYRLVKCNEKLLELNPEDDLYKHIETKAKSYESILNKLKYDE